MGVNAFTDSAPSPLTAGADGGFMAVDPAAEAEQIARLEAHRAARDQAAAEAALAALGQAAREGRNIMEPSIACARAGVTTGEWAGALRADLRRVPGTHRRRRRAPRRATSCWRLPARRSSAPRRRLGRRLKILVGKPGLDGHSNGAEQIAVAARDSGMEVVYEGIRLTPARIVNTALEEGVHLVGLSILSGSHMALVTDVLERMRRYGLGDVPVVVGGIVPPEDARALMAAGVARVYTPKDYAVHEIMADIARLAAGSEKPFADPVEMTPAL